ncbi:hypothetical protein EYF80_022366 [Liparis tanakae]|uniref:Uncharacterized protein n=1 Tax=Liparis tanakae TaxID=230148 RepID=A0A4Z2HPC1_9TELE|nr:hypothetical protein EYF80_022366 [Liparis tanakae]
MFTSRVLRGEEDYFLSTPLTLTLMLTCGMTVQQHRESAAAGETYKEFLLRNFTSDLKGFTVEEITLEITLGHLQRD